MNWIAYAHENEVHGSGVESLSHYFDLLAPIYISLPMFIGLLALIYFALKGVGIGDSARLLVMLFFIFALAIFFLVVSPTVGAIGLVFGFVYSGFLVFAGIKEG